MILPKCPYCGWPMWYQRYNCRWRCDHCNQLMYPDHWNAYPWYWRATFEETGWDEVG